jgi:hypothetical protein
MYFIGFDDTIDTKKTDADGTFSVSGSTSELTSIDPYLKIYHKCNAPFTQVKRRSRKETRNYYKTIMFTDLRHTVEDFDSGQVH